MLKERNEIPKEDKWNVEALYPSYEEWEKDLLNMENKEGEFHFSKVERFKGVLGENPKNIASVLQISLAIERRLQKLYTYAHLRNDEDVANDLYKKAHIRITTLLYEFKRVSCWIEPELLQIPERTFQKYIQDKELEPYRTLLEKLFRLKPHTLSSQEEKLVALADEAMQASQRAFSAFNNADLKFPNVVDEKGEAQELSHGKYLVYLRGGDRVLRENAYKTLHKSFESYENTICELISGEVQSHVFAMRSRKYDSCLQTALFPQQIDTSVYTSLIQTVRENLPSLHRYMQLRKLILGYKSLHMFDLHVPLVKEVDMSMDYKTAEQLVIDSVWPLGAEYQKSLEKGLKEDRWVDRYENLRKRSGAYSSGCYDSSPYILMNFHGTFQDVLTLAHEAGHSMHSLLSDKNQPFQYAQYPIFLAEVASTFNEELLLNHFLTKIESKEQRCYLLNQKIEDLRSTFFRQTMFAEFELKLHTWAEQGIAITPTLLKSEYRKINLEYFGPDVVVDQETDIEWARIPHFYYNFYVYQYATGISAAHTFYEMVKKDPQNASEKYLQFLKSGSSDYPLEILKKAGVDMCSSEPTKMLIQYFDSLVSQLGKEMNF